MGLPKNIIKDSSPSGKKPGVRSDGDDDEYDGNYGGDDYEEDDFDEDEEENFKVRKSNP
jgi:hypothetical protein